MPYTTGRLCNFFEQELAASKNVHLGEEGKLDVIFKW